MSTRKWVLFQTFRLEWFFAKNMVMAKASEDASVKKIHTDLATLAQEALFAIRSNTENAFLNKLDDIGTSGFESELDRMIAGKGDDIPSWLRK